MLPNSSGPRRACWAAPLRPAAPPPNPPSHHRLLPHSAACANDSTWVRVRGVTDARGGYTAEWGALGGAAYAFDASRVATMGNYKSANFLNIYNPEAPMWVNGNSSRLLCAWWFFPSPTL